MEGIEEKIYFKILLKEEFEEFQKDKEFRGTSLDLKDGFLHLSYKEQVQGTISLFFKGVKELYLLKIDPKGYTVKLENGFPHFYDSKLLYSSVLSVEHIIY